MNFKILIGLVTVLVILLVMPLFLIGEASEEPAEAEPIEPTCRFVDDTRSGQKFTWEPRADGWCYGSEARPIP